MFGYSERQDLALQLELSFGDLVLHLNLQSLGRCSLKSNYSLFFKYLQQYQNKTTEQTKRQNFRLEYRATM